MCSSDCAWQHSCRIRATGVSRIQTLLFKGAWVHSGRETAVCEVLLDHPLPAAGIQNQPCQLRSTLVAGIKACLTATVDDM